MASILYLQLRGYAKIREEPHYRFLFDAVLPAINRELVEHGATIRQSWSDVVVAAFEDHYQAAKCALEVRDVFHKTNWRALGFRLEPKLALHVGPTFCGRDPLVEREVIAGIALELAARISALAPPGEVLVSEALASLLRSTLKDEEDVTIAVAPLGETSTARQAGTGDLFRLYRGSDASAGDGRPADLLEGIDTALKSLGVDVGARSGSIRLLDPTADNKYTVFACLFGPGSERIRHDRLPADKGVAASVIKLRRSRISNRLAADRNFDPRTAEKAGIPPANMVTAPILLRDRVLGVIQLVNKDGDFTPDDVRRVEDFARVHAPALGEYVSRWAEEDRRSDLYEGLRECTILYTDITHSGLLIEEFESRGELDIYTQLLEEYVQKLDELAQEHQCRVTTFMGDGVMMLANAPNALHGYSEVAAKLAVAVTRATRELFDSWLALAIPVGEARSRIGIATGTVQLKTLGAGPSRVYTAIGPAANLAWKLLVGGDREHDSVTMDERTYQLCGPRVPELHGAERVELAGAGDAATPTAAYRLTWPADRRLGFGSR